MTKQENVAAAYTFHYIHFVE